MLSVVIQKCLTSGFGDLELEVEVRSGGGKGERGGGGRREEPSAAASVFPEVFLNPLWFVGLPRPLRL